MFERDGTRIVSLAGEAPGDSTGKCVPFVLSGFLSAFGYAACGVVESGREDGTDLYFFRVGWGLIFLILFVLENDSFGKEYADYEFRTVFHQFVPGLYESLPGC